VALLSGARVRPWRTTRGPGPWFDGVVTGSSTATATAILSTARERRWRRAGAKTAGAAGSPSTPAHATPTSSNVGRGRHRATGPAPAVPVATDHTRGTPVLKGPWPRRVGKLGKGSESTYHGECRVR